MRPFEYSRVDSVDMAVSAAQDPQTAVIAGGTELVNLLKEGIGAPERIVDINGLTELDYLRIQEHRISIGALARMSRVAEDATVRRECPALAQALLSSASPQIRSMASVGGNLLQRTRCPYFRTQTSLTCNKRFPGTGCAARGAEDRTLAIFGGSEHCIATHPSDAAVALAALEASVRIRGPRGERYVPIDRFYRVPGGTPHVETTLASGDIVCGVTVPRSPAAKNSVYLKLRDRSSYDFALVSVAVAAVVREGFFEGVRIALGGVAPLPWRFRNSEDTLAGCAIADAQSIRRALEEDLEAAQPGRRNEFKVELAARATVRALQTAGGVA